MNNVTKQQLYFSAMALERVEDDGLKIKIADFQKELEKNNYHGIYEIEDEIYHNCLGVSSSQLKVAANTMSKWFSRYVLREVEPNKDANSPLTVGSLFHKFFLEPDKVHDSFYPDGEIVDHILNIKPDIKSVRATKDYKFQKELYERKGITLISQEVYDAAKAVAEKVHSHQKVKPIMQGALIERAIFAIDPVTGLICKTKPDIFNRGVFVGDYKTTIDASTEAFGRAIYNYDYHVQAEFYKAVANDFSPAQMTPSAWICTEKEKPYDTNVIVQDPFAVHIGVFEYNKRLAKIANALVDNKFEGFPEKFNLMDTPLWTINRYKDKIPAFQEMLEERKRH